MYSYLEDYRDDYCECAEQHKVMEIVGDRAWSYRPAFPDGTNGAFDVYERAARLLAGLAAGLAHNCAGCPLFNVYHIYCVQEGRPCGDMLYDWAEWKVTQ